MNAFEAVWTGILAALVASLVWFLIFRLLRPNIKIAPRGIWHPDTGYIQIKILNSTSRDVIDVRFQLDVLRPKVGPKGITLVRSRVVVDSQPPVIIARKHRGNDDANAYRIAASLDLSQVFTAENNSFVRLRVFCRDAVSGVGRVTEGKFHSEGDFPEGEYEKGQTFAIEPR